MKTKKILFSIVLAALVVALSVVTVFATGDVAPAREPEAQAQGQQSSAVDSTGSKAWAAALAVGLAAAGGALGMGMAISKSAEGISRQPEAEGRIRTAMMLGLVFIETAIIYALIVAILIIFVL